MDGFLTQPVERQRVLYEEAGRRLGLSAGSVEKDLWVCWTLRALFGLPSSGSHLTFKGGTSLSKGWKLIERFSEDIDIVIDREFLGFGGCDAYPPAMGAAAYVRPVVKIEFGGRSDTEPSSRPAIAPYLADVFPDEVGDFRFTVRAVAPERTFWEKVALLHEESYREGSAAPKARLARHYYDLWCLITRGVAERSARDVDLFDRVAAHRAVFFRRSRDAQSSFKPGSLRLVPTADRLTQWRRDYDAMRESMFFGEAPTFDEVLVVVAGFEERFNAR